MGKRRGISSAKSKSPDAYRTRNNNSFNVDSVAFLCRVKYTKS